MTECSVPECARTAVSWGLCNMHYQRQRTHGDTSVSKCPKPERFAIAGFYAKALAYTGDECLIWPFARCSSGYAIMTHKGKHGRIVSRLICEEVNGPAPTPQYQAAHSCGRGHEACVTPRHLSWKTSAQNHQDRIAHGTDPRGERNPRALLSEADVIEIRRLHAAGDATRKQLRERFGVSEGAMYSIIRRRTWQHI